MDAKVPRKSWYLEDFRTKWLLGPGFLQCLRELVDWPVVGEGDVLWYWLSLYALLQVFPIWNIYFMVIMSHIEYQSTKLDNTVVNWAKLWPCQKHWSFCEEFVITDVPVSNIFSTASGALVVGGVSDIHIYIICQYMLYEGLSAVSCRNGRCDSNLV